MKSLSRSTLILLEYSRNSEHAWTWSSVSKAFDKDYAKSLGLISVIKLCAHAYNEVLKESKFEINDEDAIESLVLAPITGFYSVADFPNVMDSYKIEEFYNSIVQKILGTLSVAKTDWMQNKNN